MKSSTVLAAALLVLASLTGAARAQPAAAAFNATTINIGATGEVRIKPDIGSVNLGVSTEAPTAQAASQENAAKMSAVLSAVRRAGVAERDIQTSGFNLNPVYRPRPGQVRTSSNTPPERVGYQASNSVSVTVRDLARAGQILDAAMTAGANQVRGVNFRLDDPTQAQNAAREAAVKAVEAKAQLYARATGHRVVRLVSLTEGTGGGTIPPLGVPAVSRGEDIVVTGSTVAPGELVVRINVGAIYELAR